MATPQRPDIQLRLLERFGMRNTTILDMDRTMVPVVVIDDLRDSAAQERLVSFYLNRGILAGNKGQVQIRNPADSGVLLVCDRVSIGPDQDCWIEVNRSSADFASLITTKGYIDGRSEPFRELPVIASGGFIVGAPNGTTQVFSALVDAAQAPCEPRSGYQVPPGWAFFVYGSADATAVRVNVTGRIRPLS